LYLFFHDIHVFCLFSTLSAKVKALRRIIVLVKNDPDDEDDSDSEEIVEPNTPMEEIIIPIPNIINCKLVESSVIVFNHEHCTFLYNAGRYFGKPIGVRKPKGEQYFHRPLELSFIEAYYLLKKKKIQILNPKSDKYISLDELASHARIFYDNFMDQYEIYEDLREKGYIVRPGLKFGADFAVYKKGPGIDHSPFLIQVLPKTAKLSAKDIVLAGRLANSVKKKFIIANALTRTYYGFKWYKP
jgi:tRNA-intron endonuclease